MEADSVKIFSFLFAAFPWLPYEVTDQADCTKKLVACSTYDERMWRDLSKGRWEAKHQDKYCMILLELFPFLLPNFFTASVGEFSETRPCPLGEEVGSSALRPKSDNKCKESSMGEDFCSEAGFAWR